MGSHLADVWFQVTDLDVVSGSGSTVTTSDGTEYLDFTAGIAVVSTGHCPPRGGAGNQGPAAEFNHRPGKRHPLPLVREVRGPAGGDRPDRNRHFLYPNPGAEATEAAVKLAK